MIDDDQTPSVPIVGDDATSAEPVPLIEKINQSLDGVLPLATASVSAEPAIVTKGTDSKSESKKESKKAKSKKAAEEIALPTDAKIADANPVDDDMLLRRGALAEAADATLGAGAECTFGEWQKRLFSKIYKNKSNFVNDEEQPFSLVTTEAFKALSVVRTPAGVFEIRLPKSGSSE